MVGQAQCDLSFQLNLNVVTTESFVLFSFSPPPLFSSNKLNCTDCHETPVIIQQIFHLLLYTTMDCHINSMQSVTQIRQHDISTKLSVRTLISIFPSTVKCLERGTITKGEKNDLHLVYK